ncbi:Peroxiredoxin [Ectothiorhodospira mobilis]|uniref:Peroxiredoxin n=1 Tax=Ectothiorhodospira mobilis TaxID=195064 RepID=A0A1I4PC10_ECTMO|nr:TlpA disulfide reductase family protein [Ectothiorhodospira mobilis]SFM24903.1 Peroxiredoxin [Ectothiorhodospira mobilis]
MPTRAIRLLPLLLAALCIAPSGAAPLAGQGMQGAQAPAFTLPDLEGNPRRIGEWDGRVVLVNFWATWCPPCRKEIPLFVEMQSAHGDAGLTIVGVALDDPQAAAAFARDQGINFPVLVGGEERAGEVARAYGNPYGSLPYSVLLDREGKVRYIHVGRLHRETLERELAPLL